MATRLRVSVPLLMVATLISGVPLASAREGMSTLAEVRSPSRTHPHMDLARMLLREVRTNQGLDPLERAVALVKVAESADESSAPRRYVDLRAGEPSRAAAGLFATLGASVAPNPGIAALDALPKAVRLALAQTIDAFVQFSKAAADAYGGNTSSVQGQISELSSAPASPAGVSQTTTAVPAPLREARLELLDTVVVLRGALAAAPSLTGEPIQVPPYLSLELDGTDTTYPTQTPFMLMVDVGGDDTYLNNAGGNRLYGCFGTGLQAAAALIDLAGNDRYGNAAGDGNWQASDCGRNGGGYVGAGFLADVEGHDVYAADDQGSNGGALDGAGFLLDPEGNDTFSAGQWGTNGGAWFGAGFLLDGGGDDVFDADGVATNGGGESGGTGFLVDLAGDDVFLAGDFGTNGGGFGGSGFLLDAKGDDVYAAGGAGVNGGAAIYGFFLGVQSGFLLDGEGDDSYLAASNGANGGGGTNYVNIGTLLDRAGTDKYQDDLIPGGAARDCTVSPKGTIGVQVDATSVGCASTIPTAPAFTAPRSRTGSANTVEITGIGKPDATISLYSGGRCRGPVAGTTEANTQGGFTITLGVENDSTTAFYADASSAGETSICSRHPFLYVEDSSPPEVTLDEAVPGPGLAVALSGRAGQAAGDSAMVTVELYEGSNVAGHPLVAVQVSPRPDGTWSTSVPLDSHGSGTYTAQATQRDQAGNDGKSPPRTFTI